ncbi:MAG: ABC transporter permease [Chloroflexaceae bacterium]|nr:ABC transporter permease [Chloroflexaceae bacterium]
MFGRLLPIIRKEFIHIIRDPRTLAVMFVTPLLQLILLGYAATTDVRHVPLVVFDQDRSPQSRTLVEAFVASDQFAVVQRVASESDLATLVDNGTARAGLIVPPGYASDVISGRGAQVEFVLDGSDPTVAGSSLSAARLIGQVEATQVQQRTLERRGQTATVEQPIEVRTRVWYNPDMNSSVFMVPGLIGMVLQMQATLLTSSAIVRERERGTIEQLIVTPIRPYELIIGKILPYALVALLITIEVLLIGTTLPSIFLSGFIYPVAAMPQFLQLVSGIIPLTYFLVVVRGIVIKGVDFAALLPQVVALAMFGAVLILLSSLRFRKRLD